MQNSTINLLQCNQNTLSIIGVDLKFVVSSNLAKVFGLWALARVWNRIIKLCNEWFRRKNLRRGEEYVEIRQKLRFECRERRPSY